MTQEERECQLQWDISFSMPWTPSVSPCSGGTSSTSRSSRRSAIGDGQFVVLTPTKSGLTIGFQCVPEEKSGKNRLHLDLIVEDLERSTSEIEALGGRWLQPGTTHELEGFRWRCMADPEGNEFDIDVVPEG